MMYIELVDKHDCTIDWLIVSDLHEAIHRSRVTPLVHKTFVKELKEITLLDALILFMREDPNGDIPSQEDLWDYHGFESELIYFRHEDRHYTTKHQSNELICVYPQTPNVSTTYRK